LGKPSYSDSDSDSDSDSKIKVMARAYELLSTSNQNGDITPSIERKYIDLKEEEKSLFLLGVVV